MMEVADMREPHFRETEHCPGKVTKDDTNMKLLMAEHARLSKLDPDDNIFKSAAYYCFTEYSSVDIHRHIRVTLRDLTKVPNLFHKRRFFLCRTVTASIRIHSLLAVVETPDASTKYQGTLLSLGNYIRPVDEKTRACEAFLKPGTIILVKNPLYFKSSNDSFYTVKCDNPGDVVILEQEVFCYLFQKLKWPSRELQSEENCLLTKPRWCWSKPTKDWKRVAELRLEKKNYLGALQAYEFALSCSPRDVEILNLRSDLCLKLKVYLKAYRDSRAILDIDKGNRKGIYSKALSLIGLGQYTFALQFLETSIERCRSSVDAEHKAELLKIEAKAMTWSRQNRCGEYDLVEMFERPSNFIHDCANYMGNVRKQDIVGKGKGVVATADIECGELLLAEKAFALVYPHDENFKTAMVHTSVTKELWTNTHLKLVSSIAHRLLLDKDLGKELYGLFDGTKRSVSKQCRYVKDYNFIDMKRISLICQYNNFSTNTDTSTHGNDDSCEGLWVFASYFNHSCYDANSFCLISGDFIFIRASTNIRKNEEINISYVSCYIPYPERRSALSKYGFVCQCSLCQLDAKDSDAVHIRRQEILTDISNMNPEIGSRYYIMEKLIQKLTYLRPDDLKLNICIQQPLMTLANCLERKQEYECAANIYDFLQNLSCGTIMNKISLLSCCHALVCYMSCGKIEEATRCVGALQAILIQKFGTDSQDIIDFVSKDLSKFMTLCGINY